MKPPTDPEIFRFGDYQFNTLTGDLLHQVEDRETTSRLSPQPASLLNLLLRKQGELLAKDEIRAELWPDTHLDFESSLHFCVRQIRAALNDDAQNARYIETLPRRGYRMVVPVQPLAAVNQVHTGNPSADNGAGAHRPTGRRASGNLQLVAWAALVPSALLAAGLLAFLLSSDSKTGLTTARGRMEPKQIGSTSVAPQPAPLRLAVLPFEIGLANPRLETRAARLSEGLTAALTKRYAPRTQKNESGPDAIEPRVRILGPASTTPYRTLPFPRLEDLERELDIDLVLNARIVGGDTNTAEPSVEGILIELIQTNSGAHLWADFFPATEDWIQIERPILLGVSLAIETLTADFETG